MWCAFLYMRTIPVQPHIFDYQSRWKSVPSLVGRLHEKPILKANCIILILLSFFYLFFSLSLFREASTMGRVEVWTVAKDVSVTQRKEGG